MILGLKNKVPIAIFTVIAFMIITSSCMRKSDFPIDHKVICDVEKLSEKNDNLIGQNNPNALFNGGNLRTDKEAYSGKYSVLTIPKTKAFALAFEIKRIEPDAYLEVSVWRKSKDGMGNLVLAANNVDDLYMATKEPTEIAPNGWEKLEMEIYTPPNYRGGKLKIYVWNNGSDSVYFDDLIIHRKRRKSYPNLNYQKGINLVIDTSDFIGIMDKRREAFIGGILQVSDNDWIKGIVVNNDVAMKAKMRLKGDWLDHLWGDKWSYRVKMRKQNTFNRMKTFSLQTPSARNYLLEWLTHKLYHKFDMLTTRYGFIPLLFNGQPRGLYVWEEHFEKQLPEWNNRREGPIVKFSEDSFWQVQKQNINHKKWPNFPYYYSSIIEPFGKSRTLSSPNLRSQFESALKLMEQYKYSTKLAHQIFDVDKLAKYYAMLDLTHARHGMTWHNQRFYYNPVICKLEPIAFDGYTSHDETDFSINDNMAYKAFTCDKPLVPQDRLILNLFTDTIFLEAYLDYLELFSEDKMITQFTTSIDGEIDYYDSLLKLEFPKYHNESSFLENSAAGIRDYLPDLKKIIDGVLDDGDFTIQREKEYYYDSSLYERTPEFFVAAYIEGSKDDKLVVKINNYFLRDIELIGSGIDEKLITEFFDEKPIMKAFVSNETSMMVEVDSISNSLFFKVNGSDELFTVPFIPWAYPTGITPQQELMGMADPNNELVSSLEDGRILIKPGKSIIRKPIIIPSGYEVYFEEGTVVDLIDSAMIISYSPVFFEGTKDNPVIITSSDFTGNGFTVLQAEGQSRINNAVFENLNTLNYKTWVLTGALTFYESDVLIDNVKFYRNQCEDALNIIRSEFTVVNSTFDFTFGDAFDADFCTGEVRTSTFENIGNDAMDFSGSIIKIINTSVLSANDKGISGGEDSQVKVINTNILRSNIGIASKDLSVVDVEDSNVEYCNFGVVLLQKKPEFGPSQLILKNTIIKEYKTKMLIEEGSFVIVDNSRVDGTETNLSDEFY